MFRSRFVTHIASIAAALIIALGSAYPALAAHATNASRPGALSQVGSGGAYTFDTQTTVSVSQLRLFPPNPCTQAISVSGDFVIWAHIVYPPGPVFPPGPIIPAGTIVTLGLDATQISGIGLMDGALYQGSQGTSENFVFPPIPMRFDTSFELLPSPTNLFPPNPCSPAQLAFDVQIYVAEGGIPAISASLDTADLDK